MMDKYQFLDKIEIIGAIFPYNKLLVYLTLIYNLNKTTLCPPLFVAQIPMMKPSMTRN